MGTGVEKMTSIARPGSTAAGANITPDIDDPSLQPRVLACQPVGNRGRQREALGTKSFGAHHQF